MSPVPEQKPMIPPVYPRPSPMASTYLYCARQSSDEFSLLDTSCIAMSFLRGSNRSTLDIVTDGVDSPRIPLGRPSKACAGPGEELSTDEAVAGWFSGRN